MSSENASRQLYVVAEQSYTLEYELLQSVNPYFEEFQLTEYGIQCKLYDTYHQLLSEEAVRHITPEKNFIDQLLEKLVLHKVFPVHLLDVVTDELAKELDFSY